MRVYSPLFTVQPVFCEGEPFLLVLENPTVFRLFLEDLHRQIAGEAGKTDLSYDDVPVSLAKNAEILEMFTPFDINTKTLLSRIAATMEKAAADERHLMRTAEILAAVERYLAELCFDLPFRAECRKLSAASLIKAASVSVAEEHEEPLDEILSYFSLVRELEGDRLFITVNLRSYFEEEPLLRFLHTARSRQFRLLMLENWDRGVLPGIRQLIVDRDRCEI